MRLWLLGLDTRFLGSGGPTEYSSSDDDERGANRFAHFPLEAAELGDTLRDFLRPLNDFRVIPLTLTAVTTALLTSWRLTPRLTISPGLRVLMVKAENLHLSMEL